MIGIGFGFGVSFWVIRMVRHTAERYSPERVGTDVAGAVRGFGEDVRAALAEGRAAMREREAELRAELSRDPRPTQVPPPQSPE